MKRKGINFKKKVSFSSWLTPESLANLEGMVKGNPIPLIKGVIKGFPLLMDL